MNMNRFVQERCRLTVPAFVLGLTLALLPSTALVAQDSVYSGGLFELGDAAQPPGFAGMGDIVLLAGQPGPDWEDLFTADGSFRDDYPPDDDGNPFGNGVPDYVELYGGQWALFTADDVSLGSGFESTALDTDGRVKNGTVTGNAISEVCGIWDGDAGNGLWSDPLNWVGDIPPGPNPLTRDQPLGPPTN